jgi:hypothetical protein
MCSQTVITIMCAAQRCISRMTPIETYSRSAKMSR